MSDASSIIYHYTNTHVLKSIFENNELWASDILYMNDAQELIYAKEAAEEVLQSIIIKMGPSESTDDIVHSKVSTLQSILLELEKLGTKKYLYQRVYAACFCENGDLLSQWRAYGGSGGYAIGFRSEVLSKCDSLLSENTPISLEKVIYGLDNARPLFEELINVVATTPTGHPGVQGYHQFGTEVIPRLAKVKNPAFKEEAEWRLSAIGEDSRNVSFREAAIGLVPYIKYSLPKDAIAEIIIGPGPEQHLKGDVIRQLLVKHSPSSSVSISFSKSPLRS